MRRKLFRAIGRATLIVAGLALITGPLAAGPREGRPFHWTGTLTPGKTLTIRGINGGIRAERSSGAQVVVDAEKWGRRDDPDRVEIAVEEDRDGVTICARYPRWWGGGLTDCGGLTNTRNDVVVEYTVRVPAGVEADLATVNGRIEASDLQSPLRVRTVNGSVRLATTGPAEARTVNGTIVARMTPHDRGSLRFATVNGSIRLDLPRDAQAEVRAHTINGSIRSDFPVTIHGGWIGHRLIGRLGHGGPDVEMVTVNGSIELRSF